MTDPTPQTPAPASAAEVLTLLADYVEADHAWMSAETTDADENRCLASRVDSATEALRQLNPSSIRALAAAQPAPAPAGLREALARYEAADERCACAFTNDMRGMVERRTAEDERRDATVALAGAARALLAHPTTPPAAGAGAEEAAIPPEIVRIVTTLGAAQWGKTAPDTAEGHAEQMALSVRLTAEHFGLGDAPRELHGLFVEGTDTVIAYVGTSPNSPEIARALTGAWNYLLDQCRAAQAQAEGEELCPVGGAEGCGCAEHYGGEGEA